MRFRGLLLFFIALLFSFGIGAQEFITLDWKHPAPRFEGFDKVETDMPGFAGASYQPECYLPLYTYTHNLGRDFRTHTYRVLVEYPEYQLLSKKEIQAIEQCGVALPSHPEVTTQVAVSAKEGILSTSFVPLVHKDGNYYRITSFKLTVVPQTVAKSVRTTASEGNAYAAHSVLASGKWVKIKVQDTGVYKITRSELAKMGFSNPSQVRLYGYGGRLLSEDLKKNTIDDIQEIPLWREADYVLFYGYGTVRWDRNGTSFVHKQNCYATYGCYFLTESDQQPMAFPQVEPASADGAETVTTFPDYALYEKEEFAWLEAGRMLFEAYDYKNGDSKSYTFTGLDGITDDEGVVTVSFSAYDKSNNSSVTVQVDGKELPGSMQLQSVGSDYVFAAQKEMSFDWSGSKNAKSIVTLKHERKNSATSGHLDFIRLNFTRKLALYNAYTAFRPVGPGRYHYKVANATANTCVWRVDNPAQYQQLNGTLADGTFSFVCDAEETAEFVAVDPKGTSFLRVESMGTVANQDLHQLKEVDMVVITPPNTEYIQQADRLIKAHEKHDSLRSVLVTSEQVYNEFSSGTPDATAYRRLMKMLYDQAPEGQEPKYLLLFGDAMFDNRFLTDYGRNFKPENFLLCFESQNSLSKVASFMSDDYLGMLDDDDAEDISRLHRYAVDLGVGRIPVRTGAEAKQVVDMLIDYMENTHQGKWKNAVAFLGDDGKNSDDNIHMEQADAVAERALTYNPSLLVNKVYWDAYQMEKTATGNAYPAVRERLSQLFKEGMLFFNYTGHGDARALSDEYVVTLRDIDGYVSNKPPFWFTAACDVAPVDRSAVSLGETAFLKGAAIGLMSTARTVYPNQNCLMDSVFIRYLFDEGKHTGYYLGDAVRKTKAKLALGNPDINHLQFVFIGDPALRLSVPQYRLVVDEFNGVSVESELLPQIKAGGKARVKGRVLTPTGEPASDFFGLLHARVLDNREKIVTYNNNGLSDAPFEYYDRKKTLYAGVDSVRAGVFDFQFPVPMDINYSDKSGLLNLYAVNTEARTEGQGAFTDFIVGGTEDGAMDTDSIGPDITLYLNTPDFMHGSKVNSTPCLVAELEDIDGINASGNGIGHDIVAVIDNSPLHTYVLNENYTPVFGDYTKGQVLFSLPQLSEGKHTLLFRAWDVKNNSSAVVIDFEVVHGLAVDLDITCTQSPAVDHTLFILSHDRPYAPLEVGITVYDYAGRTLWSHHESGIAEGNYYYVDWDLKTNGGQRLVPGIYLYKATIASDGSKETTETRKIVVAGQ